MRSRECSWTLHGWTHHVQCPSAGPERAVDDSARLFVCARCRAQVVLCRRCDRGQRYCGTDCSQQARQASLREAACRYQASYRGRVAHAQRARRYRARRKIEIVTHQGSPMAVPDAVVAPSPPAAPTLITAIPVCRRCQRCGAPVSQWLRSGFVRRRRGHRHPDHRGRRAHDHWP